MIGCCGGETGKRRAWWHADVKRGEAVLSRGLAEQFRHPLIGVESQGFDLLMIVCAADRRELLTGDELKHVEVVLLQPCEVVRRLWVESELQLV